MFLTQVLRYELKEQSLQMSPGLRNHQPQTEDKGQCHSPTYCVGDVVDHNGSLGPPVVHGCQAVIPFLSCSVPDLKLDCCIIQTYRLCEEGSWGGNNERD